MKLWEIKYESEFTNEDGGGEEIVALLLTNRGLEAKEDIEHFLYPKLEDVTFKTVLIDEEEVKKTIKRIQQAIKNKEQVIVYGDYDVDGITGCAILWETLHRMEANVMPYIPHRIDEGYGLSVKGISNVKLQMPNVKLIITVDNGIVSNKAVDFANEQGIEVIITDHHVAAAEAVQPKAYAIVHTTKLCGAGVAYLLAQELKKIVSPSHHKGVLLSPQNDSSDDHLELAALGTIADLVPLTGANRTIVKEGLKRLAKTKRKGLHALFVEAELDSQAIGVYQVGHVIGPRLNAAGRMETAMDSLRLLCTKDDDRARQLALLLGKTNKERQVVMADATMHASLEVKKRIEIKKLLVVAHESYPEGVIGLVAGRLVEEYYRPAIVISKGEVKSKGSVRSINGFNMIEFLRTHVDHFVNVGGHPMAAGFTIETAKLEFLQELLETAAEELLDEITLTRKLKIDALLPLSFVTNDLFKAIQVLEPFGMGNPEPTFATEKVEIKDMRALGKEGKHLKLMVQEDFGRIYEAIAFGMGEMSSELQKGDLIDIAYTIDENTWNGQTKLQLKVKDIHTPRS